MTSTDTYGGKCPNCGYNKIFMRYGSSGIFQYDACPKCGFAYGYNGHDKPLVGKEFWEDSVLFALFKPLLKENKLPISRQGLYRLTLRWGNNLEEPFSVFSYDEEAIKGIMNKVRPRFIFT
jgi:hypothetical protein